MPLFLCRILSFLRRWDLTGFRIQSLNSVAAGERTAARHGKGTEGGSEGGTEDNREELSTESARYDETEFPIRPYMYTSVYPFN